MRVVDGKLALVLKSSGSSSTSKVMMTDDPSGAWEAYDIVLSNGKLLYDFDYYVMEYNGGKWYLAGGIAGSSDATTKAGIYVTDDLAKEWTAVSTMDSTAPLWNAMGFYGERDAFVIGKYGTSLRISRTGAWLPTLAHDKLYTYIKAKE
jgi:hypothetical protein